MSVVKLNAGTGSRHSRSHSAFSQLQTSLSVRKVQGQDSERKLFYLAVGNVARQHSSAHGIRDHQRQHTAENRELSCALWPLSADELAGDLCEDSPWL